MALLSSFPVVHVVHHTQTLAKDCLSSVVEGPARLALNGVIFALDVSSQLLSKSRFVLVETSSYAHVAHVSVARAHVRVEENQSMVFQIRNKNR